MIVFGSFLAGAIISLLIPVGAFVAVLVWYLRSLGQVRGGGESGSEPPGPQGTS
jgi:hypothetical protein